MRFSAGVFTQRRIGRVCAVAAGALVVSPLTAPASSELGGSQATAAAAAGTVFGGKSAQDYPVVIETSANGRKVVRASIAIRLNCASGGGFTTPDNYTSMAVTKKRKFGASYGPDTSDNDDGTAFVIEGDISGGFNKARTKASGRWSFKLTELDAAGAVIDTCDSGTVSWTAKQ